MDYSRADFAGLCLRAGVAPTLIAWESWEKSGAVWCLWARYWRGARVTGGPIVRP